MNSKYLKLRTTPTPSPFSGLYRSAASVLLAGAVVATALVAAPVSVYAASDDVVAVDTSELEAVFWTCDYAASTQGVDRNTAVLCGSATDELKIKRFGGSFERMLEWWNANKAEQYAALSSALAERAKIEPTAMEMGFPESI